MAAPRSVVIAGAGIGGLTAALALAARGFDVHILEKAERLEAVGAGIQLSPNASRVLISLGLEPRLASVVLVPDAISIMTARSGGEVNRLPLERLGAPYWALHRADLQAAQLSACGDHPQIQLHLGQPVTDFDIDAHGAVVVPGLPPALALIGADGVHSQVRRRLFPGVEPHFSGLVAWRGTVESWPHELPPRRVELWMGPQAHLVAYPMSSGGRVNVVAIVPGSAEESNSAAADIARHFAASRWPAGAVSIIAAVREWRRWPLFTLPDGGVWNAGPVTLLGDASHAMLPFAAQGAGMAIEDAAMLAHCLTGTDATGVGAALARYAGLRAPRVGRVQRMARQSGQIYHLRGPMALARDLVMKMLGPGRLQARQDWVYDWKP